ncbi:MAG: lytic transglycosylase domain-containing protein [Gemmatimonadota bacterium]
MILRKLEERRLPRDLIYLAWIESGFLPTVESHAGAVGLWQFMPETARWLGLRVDAVVDERRDPVKSTDAALTFLSGLYRRYGSWHLAMAAYNGGPTRVSRIVRQHARGPWGHESLYWQVLEYLPTETAHYVPRLLAVRSLATERFREAPRFVPDAPYEYDVVWVSRPLTFTELSRLSGLSVEELRELNPHLVAERIPRGLEPHPLRVPVGTATRVAGTLVRPRPAFAQADD